MKIVIAGPRDYNDYVVVKRAIEASGFKITEVVSGDAKGVDKLGEKWAGENNVLVKKFPAKWRDMTLPGAVIKKNKFGPYNSTAGFYRNGQMADYAEGLVAIDTGSGGTANMIKQMEEQGKPVFKYDPRDDNGDEEWGDVF